MADETPQTPVPPAPVVAPVVPVEHSFLEKFSLPWSVLWDQYKLFFIVCGILVLIFKFREGIIDLLVSSAHHTMDDATKQDTQLKAEEKQANDQADALRKQAADLATAKPVIDEDWNKK